MYLLKIIKKKQGKMTGKLVFSDGTHNRLQTTDGYCDLETESAQRANSVKIKKLRKFWTFLNYSLYTVQWTVTTHTS